MEQTRDLERTRERREKCAQGRQVCGRRQTDGLGAVFWEIRQGAFAEDGRGAGARARAQGRLVFEPIKVCTAHCAGAGALKSIKKLALIKERTRRCR